MSLPDLNNTNIFNRQHLQATMSKPHMVSMNNESRDNVGVWTEYFCTGDCNISLPPADEHAIGDFVEVHQMTGETVVTFGSDTWNVIKAVDEPSFIAYALFKIVEIAGLPEWKRIAVGGEYSKVRDLGVTTGGGGVDLIIDDNLLAGYKRLEITLTGSTTGQIEVNTTALSKDKEIVFRTTDTGTWSIQRDPASATKFFAYGITTGADSVSSGGNSNEILTIRQYDDSNWTPVYAVGEWINDANDMPLVPAFVSPV